MSFLAEIINSAEKVHVDDINKLVPDLKRNVETLKNEVIATVENVYVKYITRRAHTEALFDMAVESQQTLTALQEKLQFIANKDLVKTELELNRNINELANIDFALKVFLNVLNALNLLNLFNKELKAKQYLKCVDIGKELGEYLAKVPEDESLEVIDQVKLSACENGFKLKNILDNIFTDNIDVKSSPEKQVAEIKVKRANDEIKTALLALYADEELVYPLNRLAKLLWDLVLVPIVDSTVELTHSEDANYLILVITTKIPERKANYKTVFDNLKKVLLFLMETFNYSLCDDLTTLGYIGNDIRDNLSELIIKNCLRDTVPSTAEGLQKYKTVIEHTSELEQVLLQSGVFTPKTSSILDYASNIDVLFINKKCQEYLTLATSIMKKDLHDMVEVGVPFDPEYPLGKELDDFPQCCISKNVKELLKFCEEIMQESLKASPECGGRLFTTVTNILVKYYTFVPEFHKNYLTTLPQQIALFMNNCQYISHVLLKWNVQYCAQLRNTLVSCDFTDQSVKFALVGLETFSNYMDGQIQQINEIMAGAHLDCPTLESLDPKTEKCIRQCLRQQELLKTVWHKVLSYEMYNKNMGTIVNTLCVALITAILKFEDIVAKVAEQLVEVLKLILTRAPKLFLNPKEITLFVSSWYKLNEVSFLLNASLVEINDRWADGKGPLALQFSKEELKHVIKALFQNTDRRAALLAKIDGYVK